MAGGAPGALGALLLADAGLLAHLAAEVVQLGAVDVALHRALDALDLRRVHRERALHADAEALLADREGLAVRGALALDDRALEDLHALAGPLDDAEVDLDGVPRLERRDVVAKLL